MRLTVTKDRLPKLLARGLGRGWGPHYQPFVRVSDFASLGKSSRIPGRKTGRTHHVFSSRERGCFFITQWRDDTVDLREQFPLLPVEETECIADRLGVSHPAVRGKHIVMTTDLLLTLRRDGELPLTAIAVKESEELSHGRTLEKLEIERLYWLARGVPWKIVTEIQLPEDLVWNLEWIDAFWDLPTKIPESRLSRLERNLFDELVSRPDEALRELCESVDERLGDKLGTSMSIVRHMLARKRWRAPMSVRIDPQAPLRDLKRAA